jgi:hypothetical protein
MNDESEIWKDVFLSYFEVLSWHLPRGTEENNENINQLNQWPD